MRTVARRAGSVHPVDVVDSGASRVQELTSSLAYVSQFGVAGIGNGEFKEPSGISENLFEQKVVAPVVAWANWYAFRTASCLASSAGGSRPESPVPRVARRDPTSPERKGSARRRAGNWRHSRSIASADCRRETPSRGSFATPRRRPLDVPAR